MRSKKRVVILESAGAIASGIQMKRAEICALFRLSGEPVREFAERVSLRLGRLGASGIYGVELILSESDAERDNFDRQLLARELLNKLWELGISKLKIRFPGSLASSCIPYAFMDTVGGQLPSGMEIFLRFDSLWDFVEEPGTGVN